MNSEKDGRLGLIRSITAPLGFYVLALLIVEAFLGLVITQGSLDGNLKNASVWAGIGMFILVVGLVFTLVWFRPKHLVYDKESLTQEWNYTTQLQFRGAQNTIDTIEKLGKLAETDVLTDDEFTEKKAELLASIRGAQPPAV